MKLVAAALIVLGSIAALPADAAAVRKVAMAHDWSRTVAKTTAGGFRMGNPNAKVKLVEYGSLVCPHCRHFEETGYKPLVRHYVRSGQVSYEFRNLLLNGPDISVSLLTRCAGPVKFFAMSQFVYSTQPQWQGKLQDIGDDDKARLETMTDQQRIVRFAEIGGLPEIAARFGVTPARARQCLADQRELTRLLDMSKAAMGIGIHRTPTFVINGKISDADTWENLEPQLKAAAGGRG